MDSLKKSLPSIEISTESSGVPQKFIRQGKVSLVTDRGNVECSPDELQPGDFKQTVKNGIDVLEATPQWYARRDERERELEAANERAIKERIQNAVGEDGLVKLYSRAKMDEVRVDPKSLQPGDVRCLGSRLFTTDRWESRCRAAYEAAKQEELMARKKKDEEKAAQEAREAEQKRHEKWLQFCNSQGVDPRTVQSNDTRFVERVSEFPHGVRWTGEGLERQRQIVMTNMLAAVKAELPSVMNRMEEELRLVTSIVNSNQLLNIDFGLCDELRNYGNKYYDKLNRSGKFFDLLHREKVENAKRLVDVITNLYFSVGGKSFGPVFAKEADEGDMKRVAFNKDIFGEIIEHKISEEWRGMRTLDEWNLGSLVEFKLAMENLKKRFSDMSLAHSLMSVDDDLCHFDWNGQAGRHRLDIKEIEKFATQYAMAKSLIDADVATLKHLAEEYITMPESEKFPLLSVQPKPQMLMKDISSGASLKWVRGWLLANKIEHAEPEIDADSKRASICASFYKDGNKVRDVEFRFRDDVLVELSIYLRGVSISPDAMEEKYIGEFGAGAKVERNKGDVEVLNHVDNIIVWARDESVKITTDEIGAFAGYKTFAGLVMISEGTAQRLVFAGAEEKMRYLLFDKTSKADLVINADGTTLRCTKDGEVLKAFIKDQLPQYSRSIDNKITKIEIWDRKLHAYMEEKVKKAKEAKVKAAEEAKKAKAAAALDF